MPPDKTWEEETLELVEDARRERRKLQQRLATTQRAIEQVDQLLMGYQLALDGYRAKYGLPKLDILASDTMLSAELRGKTIAEMITHWADTHAGTFIGNDACRALAAADLFTTPAQARGSLYKQIERMPEFEQFGRGRWRRRPRVGEVPDDTRPQGASVPRPGDPYLVPLPPSASGGR